MRNVLLCSMVLLVSACSGGESESEGHVWEEQTDMINKASAVEGMIGDAEARQRERIEDQAQ